MITLTTPQILWPPSPLSLPSSSLRLLHVGVYRETFQPHVTASAKISPVGVPHTTVARLFSNQASTSRSCRSPPPLPQTEGSIVYVMC